MNLELCLLPLTLNNDNGFSARILEKGIIDPTGRINCGVILETKVENMVYFLAELAIMNYSTAIKYNPSLIVASAVYAARCTLNMAPAWNETLRVHTGFSEEQLMDCAKLLVTFHSTLAEGNLRGIYKKYLSSEREAVVLLAPTKSLLFAA